MNGLTERQQNICIYGGLFGAMLSATCLIQHIAIAGDHWMAYTLMGVYFKAMLAFILLSFRRVLSPILLIISSVLVMAALCFVLISGVYSLVLILLFLYCTVMTVVIYMERLPAGLKERALLKREEELAWRDKI